MEKEPRCLGFPTGHSRQGQELAYLEPGHWSYLLLGRKETGR